MAKRPEAVITPQEEYAYGYIINALAKGLYPNKFHVVREYAQNAFDAIVNWKTLHKDKTGSIRITIKKPSIFILDSGTGMDRSTLHEYRKVGFSKKKIGEAAGFRGIGKLAGISVAKKLIVTTSPYGIPEKYKLVFDAESMIKEIEELKKKQENISLNDLIRNHTTLTSDVEEKTDHYTMIELQDLRSDSKILFDKNKLKEYISKNLPVPFNPEFEHGKEIEDNIKQFVDDYDCVPISVDEEILYKPFAPNLKKPQHILTWDRKSKKKLLAYCWYCENSKKGQVKPPDISGLVYRHKNFAVGDNYLTRTTLWNTSAHLAFYFMGEIYITDKEILPTSQRDDFEQSAARDRFYKASTIASELSRIARESSAVRRAQEHVEKGKEIVSKISREVDEKKLYLKDLSVEKIAQLVNVIENIEQRENNIPEYDKKTKLIADQVIKKAKKLLQVVKEVEKKEFTIAKKLKLNDQAQVVYSTTIRTLKDFIEDREKLEKIIDALHKNLNSAFSKKAT